MLSPEIIGKQIKVFGCQGLAWAVSTISSMPDESRPRLCEKKKGIWSSSIPSLSFLINENIDPELLFLCSNFQRVRIFTSRKDDIMMVRAIRIGVLRVSPCQQKCIKNSVTATTEFHLDHIQATFKLRGIHWLQSLGPHWLSAWYAWVKHIRNRIGIDTTSSCAISTKDVSFTKSHRRPKWRINCEYSNAWSWDSWESS